MENYLKVPDIITGKDLDYLEDMFNWFYESYKCSVEAQDNLTDDNLIKHMKKCENTFYEFMQSILKILERKGQNEDCESEN